MAFRLEALCGCACAGAFGALVFEPLKALRRRGAESFWEPLLLKIRGAAPWRA